MVFGESGVTKTRGRNEFELHPRFSGGFRDNAVPIPATIRYAISCRMDALTSQPSFKPGAQEAPLTPNLL